MGRKDSGPAWPKHFHEGGVGDGEEPERSHLLSVGAFLVVGGEAGEFVERPNSQLADGGLVVPVGFGVLESEFDIEEVFPPQVVPVVVVVFGER